MVRMREKSGPVESVNLNWYGDQCGKALQMKMKNGKSKRLLHLHDEIEWAGHIRVHFSRNQNDLKFRVCMIQIYKKNKSLSKCYHSSAVEKGSKQMHTEKKMKERFS